MNFVINFCVLVLLYMCLFVLTSSIQWTNKGIRFYKILATWRK